MLWIRDVDKGLKKIESLQKTFTLRCERYFEWISAGQNLLLQPLTQHCSQTRECEISGNPRNRFWGSFKTLQPQLSVSRRLRPNYKLKEPTKIFKSSLNLRCINSTVLKTIFNYNRFFESCYIFYWVHLTIISMVLIYVKISNFVFSVE